MPKHIYKSWESKTWWIRDCDCFFDKSFRSSSNTWESKTWWIRDCDIINTINIVSTYSPWESKTWWIRDCDVFSSVFLKLASYLRIEDLMNKGLRPHRCAHNRPKPAELRIEDLMNKGLRLNSFALCRLSPSSLRIEDLMNKGLRRYVQEINKWKQQDWESKTWWIRDCDRIFQSLICDQLFGWESNTKKN